MLPSAKDGFSSDMITFAHEQLVRKTQKMVTEIKICKKFNFLQLFSYKQLQKNSEEDKRKTSLRIV